MATALTPDPMTRLRRALQARRHELLERRPAVEDAEEGAAIDEVLGIIEER